MPNQATVHMQFLFRPYVHGFVRAIGAESHLAPGFITRSISIIIQNLSGNEVLPNDSFPFRDTLSPSLNLEDASGAWQSGT